ncbi:cupin 2 domain-containing protein [Desulfonatronum thiosulfatophilum]|uniref:Cupin 2 domain-containing protein n=1 Tax=Desulfonatronum thiosulfatophilum TaxID=617002 RepID=A0A1G6DFK1_9BACT|nr:cupin domain-containing protein [Desulfonatronum thiosulfatophilum]SDB43645.1 cupin 2 domain-containing protein [Desulfonatronum thiosulfatophilum]
MSSNLFTIPEHQSDEEVIELLAEGRELRIERIISRGHASPPGFWYDQELDEWVALLQGEARVRFENGITRRLQAGDYLFLPARLRHRVESTSTEPPCVWLAVHGSFPEQVRAASREGNHEV